MPKQKFTPPELVIQWVKAIDANGKSAIVEKETGEYEGQYTVWNYSLWGALGRTGKPKATTQIVPLKTRADWQEAERLEKMINQPSPLVNAMIPNLVLNGVEK